MIQATTEQLLDIQFHNERLIQNNHIFSENNDKIIKLLFERSVYKKRIKVNFRKLVDNTSNNLIRGRLNRYPATHSIHRYPAKLVPHIPQLFIKNSILSSSEDVVCDPFCGSGTVLLESILHQRNSIGIELNPISRLIAKVKVTPIDPNLLLEYFQVLQRRLNTNKSIKSRDFNNIDYWFSKKIKEELTIISQSIINSISEKDIRDFFLVCFSSIIRKVSKADPRISQPVYSKYMKAFYDHRKINVFEIFTNQVFINIKKMAELFYLHNENIKATVIEGDSREIKLKKHAQIILTSPPYLNAQEYFRSMRLEYNWLGMNKKFDTSLLMNKSVGSEGVKNIKNPEINESGIRQLDSVIEKISKKSKTKAYLTYRYFNDLINVINRMERILDHEGYFILIVGNNTVCDNKVPTNEIITKAASLCGLNVKLELIDEIKRHGFMTKRNSTSGIINRESILVMVKQ